MLDLAVARDVAQESEEGFVGEGAFALGVHADRVVTVSGGRHGAPVTPFLPKSMASVVPTIVTSLAVKGTAVLKVPSRPLKVKVSRGLVVPRLLTMSCKPAASLKPRST